MTHALATCPECTAPLPRGALAGLCPRCLLRLTFSEDTPPRQVLGDYEIGAELARGGMGIVYRARQRRLGREVAVKVLRGGEFAGAEAQARFRTEAAAAARLQHPGIVAIHDVGEDAGVLWFSMDLVPGENLAARVREHPLVARDAAVCVQRVAEAVEHAHENGVLHRDLKPSNILLAADGQPRVTDFGIARHASSDTPDLTRTGQMLGSPGYAAPEQALRGEADARTDVYGLGALLYHLLTGRPPFQGPTLDSIVLQLRENEPLPPRRLNPTVPRDLETICLKCLDRNPARRYATARATAEDLARFLSEKPIIARPRSWLENSARWLRRHFVVATAALITATSLIASAVLSQRDAAHARDSESAARRLVYARDIARAQDELRQHLRRGSELLDAHLPPRDGATDLRGWEWFYLHTLASAAELIDGGAFDLRVSISPNGRTFAQGRENGGINIWDTATRRLIRTLPAGNRRITNVQWLADSRRIASCSYDADVRLHDSIDGTLLLEFPVLHRPVNEILWSADGRWFAHASWEGEIILRTARGEIVRRVPMPPGETHLAWHPQRPLLAIYGPDLRTVRVCSAEENEPPGEWPVEPAVTALAWSPDGAQLALAEDDATLRLIAADETARVVWQRAVPADGVRLLQFTPDGAQLVLGKGNGSIALVRAADGADTATIVAHTSPGIASLSAADDFGVSLGKAGDLRLWKMPRVSPDATTLYVEGAVKSLAWSPDGRFLHVNAVQIPPSGDDPWQWRAPVWDRIAAQWLAATTAPHTRMSAWSRDGRRLARVAKENDQRFITIEDFSDGKITHRFAIDAPIYSLDWDAAGTRLAASCPLNAARHIIICDLATGRTSTLPAAAHVTEAPEVGEPVAWSPDARTLLVCDGGWHYDLATARPVPGWLDYDHAGTLAVLTMAWHPRTGEIAMGRETGIVEIRAAADGRVLRQRSLHGAKLRAVAWHPTEPRLATASSDGMVKILAADTLEELLVFPTPQPDVRVLTWSPDGRTLATGAADGTILLRSNSADPQGR